MARNGEARDRLPASTPTTVFSGVVTTSQAVLATLLREHVAPTLRRSGFSGSGQDFHRPIDGNWAAINFQRDRYSTAAKLRFTINLGTASTAVRIEDGFVAEDPAREIECHWRTRIGTLLPSGDDTWWDVPAGMLATEVRLLGEAIAGHLADRAIPALERMASDEAILATYLDGEARPDLKFAAMDVVGPILRRIGPPERFKRFLAVLDGDGAAIRLYTMWDEFGPRMGPARIAKALQRLEAKGFEPRQQALTDLGFAAATPAILDAVRPGLGDTDWRIRFAAAQALGRLGDVASLPELLAMVAGDPVRTAAVHAAVALLRLAPQLGDVDRERVRVAITERRDRAVGHDRSALSEILRAATAAARAP